MHSSVSIFSSYSTPLSSMCTISCCISNIFRFRGVLAYLYILSVYLPILGIYRL